MKTEDKRKVFGEIIRRVAGKTCYSIDRWGQYHIYDYKLDFRKTNLKIYAGKTKIRSLPIQKVDLIKFEHMIEDLVGRTPIETM